MTGAGWDTLRHELESRRFTGRKLIWAGLQRKAAMRLFRGGGGSGEDRQLGTRVDYPDVLMLLTDGDVDEAIFESRRASESTVEILTAGEAFVIAEDRMRTGQSSVEIWCYREGGGVIAYRIVPHGPLGAGWEKIARLFPPPSCQQPAEHV